MGGRKTKLDMTQTDITARIRELLAPRLNRLGLTEKDITDSDNLMKQGVLDSLTLIEFVADLEEAFDIEMDFDEVDLTAFTSIEAMAVIVYNLLSKN
jgi:acyl carrier protein